MPTDRWQALTTSEDWDDALAKGGVIVKSDSADPTRYHHHDCPHLRAENFVEKVLDHDGRNGRYWWAPDAGDAEAGGATRCGAEGPDAFLARGSLKQVRTYVNDHPETLGLAIAGALPDLAGRDIDWRSPLAAEDFREYHDSGFLKAVDYADLISSLKGFWPRGGPRWDALAVVDGMGVLLVEGKSYPGELEGGGCKATPASYAAIEDALLWTRGRLGVAVHPPEDWCGPLYQSANRLAYLAWLGWRGVEAWLVHLLFTGDDPHPTSARQWHDTMKKAEARLGLAGVSVPGAAHVVLPAL